MTVYDTAAPGHESATIALVDHEEWPALTVGSVLSPHGYSVVRFRSAHDALAQIQAVSPDAILINADLPDAAGTELCRTLRLLPQIGSTTPIILISKTPARRAEQLAAFAAGAWDFITLPFDSTEMLLRLRVFVRAKMDADLAREGNLLDVETGVYSNNGIHRRLRELISDAHRHRTPIGCVIISLEAESVETIPAAVSPTSDRLVSLLSSAARQSDCVGRLSTAEFVVLAPRTSTPGVAKLAERLHRALSEALAKEFKPVRMTIGCSGFDEFETKTIAPEDILMRAATALQQAKREATPTIRFFGQPYSAS